MVAFGGVDDIDGWLEKVMTDAGEFYPPSLRADLEGPAAAYRDGGPPPSGA